MLTRRLFGYPSRGLGTAFDDLYRMRREMDRLFGAWSGRPGRAAAGVFPLVNLTEDRDNYYVRAELPGLSADDLDIQVTGRNLSIGGERRIETASESAKYHRREREAGKFSRIIGLPGDIESSDVDAKLENGILKIVVPKAEVAKPKQITIK